MPTAHRLIFVYGTLKRHGSNNHHLASQRFIAEANTGRGYTLYELDGYPGMIQDAKDSKGVKGELWEVDAPCLTALDKLEGVDEGLYVRERISLRAPHDALSVDAYLYGRDTVGRKHIGSIWPQAE